jgi:hypothetical protein
MVKGQNWETWGRQNFQSSFTEVINNPNNSIYFNLTAAGSEMINPLEAITQ